MKRYILTGAPGAGKTVILRQLELEGYSVVEEAATDLIALSHAQGIGEPWTDPAFIDAVADLQRRRLAQSSALPGQVQFHDRSVVCTAALAAYLGHPLSPRVLSDLERIVAESLCEKQVFFIRNLGFIQPTEARRISFAESLRFEQIHEDTYRRFGFTLVDVPPGPLSERVAAIRVALPSIPPPGTTSGPAPDARSCSRF